MDKWGYNYLIEQKNIVRNGEIARYEQFVRFPQCFQKVSDVDEYLLSKGLTCFQIVPGFYNPEMKILWEK